ncbi:DUF3870 domain-containing protein [Bacillus alveayuensis]|uniref:DUF3870 domain-containing protein n=1 Tax=Aeribacillus alveayuensis TaxID=279215 RepID=A0ABT9VRK7_9BACI|nr:DUF3870 domain-containing protein [Bacillus alveayuensis]MDQ0163626.1 hypothetical protein [Bacillus alveayuensis]
MGNLLFLAGHARLPQGMAARNVYETLTITVEIDRKYGVIVEASCTLATEHGREFIGRLLKGISLKDGLEEPIRILQENYKGKGANALVAAMKDLYSQFEQIKDK